MSTTLAQLIENINDSNIIKKEELIDILMNYRALTHEMLHNGPDDNKTICKCRQCLIKPKPTLEIGTKPKRKLIKKKGK